MAFPTEIQAALGASLTHPTPGAQILAAATTPHAPILDRVSWLEMKGKGGSKGESTTPPVTDFSDG